MRGKENTSSSVIRDTHTIWAKLSGFSGWSGNMGCKGSRLEAQLRDLLNAFVSFLAGDFYKENKHNLSLTFYQRNLKCLPIVAIFIHSFLDWFIYWRTLFWAPVLWVRKFGRGSDCWNEPSGYPALATKSLLKGKSPCVGKHVLRFWRQLEPSKKYLRGRESHPRWEE